MKLKINKVIQETKDAISIVFERPEGVNFLAGQFLTLINKIQGDEVRRSYSLSSAPHEKDVLTVSIKRVEGGLVSNFLGDKASSMDSMEVMEPMGNFIFTPNSSNKKHYVLFGGGSGITPMMSILKTALKEEKDSFITLFYANQDEDSIIFKKELDALQSEYDKLKIVHIVENPSDSWTGRNGRIDSSEVVRLVEAIPTNLEKVFYMCGPTGYMDQVEAGLSQMSIPSSNVNKESFVGSTEVSEDAVEGGDRMVTVVFDNEEYKYNVPAGTTILDAGLDEGIDLPYSCQSGVCTACRGKCKSGKVDLTEVEGLSEKS